MVSAFLVSWSQMQSTRDAKVQGGNVKHEMWMWILSVSFVANSTGQFRELLPKIPSTSQYLVRFNSLLDKNSSNFKCSLSQANGEKSILVIFITTNYEKYFCELLNLMLVGFQYWYYEIGKMNLSSNKHSWYRCYSKRNTPLWCAVVILIVGKAQAHSRLDECREHVRDVRVWHGEVPSSSVVRSISCRKYASENQFVG